MTYLAMFLVAVLVALLVASVTVIFALLRRLDGAHRVVLDQAQTTLSMAQEQSRAAPFQMKRMMDSLADSTVRIHDTINETVKTVLIPPPIQIVDGQGQPFPMPTMNEGKEPEPWDHTDRLMPDMEPTGPYAAMGYEHETSPDFDPENPFGIPGMKSGI